MGCPLSSNTGVNPFENSVAVEVGLATSGDGAMGVGVGAAAAGVATTGFRGAVDVAVGVEATGETTGETTGAGAFANSSSLAFN